MKTLLLALIVASSLFNAVDSMAYNDNSSATDLNAEISAATAVMEARNNSCGQLYRSVIRQGLDPDIIDSVIDGGSVNNQAINECRAEGGDWREYPRLKAAFKSMFYGIGEFDKTPHGNLRTVVSGARDLLATRNLQRLELATGGRDINTFFITRRQTSPDPRATRIFNHDDFSTVPNGEEHGDRTTATFDRNVDSPVNVVRIDDNGFFPFHQYNGARVADVNTNTLMAAYRLGEPMKGIQWSAIQSSFRAGLSSLVSGIEWFNQQDVLLGLSLENVFALDNGDGTYSPGYCDDIPSLCGNLMAEVLDNPTAYAKTVFVGYVDNGRAGGAVRNNGRYAANAIYVDMTGEPRVSTSHAAAKFGAIAARIRYQLWSDNGVEPTAEEVKTAIVNASVSTSVRYRTGGIDGHSLTEPRTIRVIR